MVAPHQLFFQCNHQVFLNHLWVREQRDCQNYQIEYNRNNQGHQVLEISIEDFLLALYNRLCPIQRIIEAAIALNISSHLG